MSRDDSQIAAADGALLKLFEEAWLDVEATRERVTSGIDVRIAEANAQAERADRGVAAKRAALDRFDRDYETGDLTAASYERQVARVTDELAALEAQAEQYAAHAERQRRIRGNLDGELETYQRLAEVRAAIAKRIAGTVPDVGPLRAAITSVFKQVWLVADPHRPGQFGVLPEPRPEMITILTPDAEGLQNAERQRVPVAFDANKCNTTQVLDQMRTSRA